LPPSATTAFTEPSITAAAGATVSSPFSVGGSKPYCSLSLSTGTSSVFSVMPTVRWP
jgi:hypothetical protein